MPIIDFQACNDCLLGFVSEEDGQFCCGHPEGPDYGFDAIDIKKAVHPDCPLRSACLTLNVVKQEDSDGVIVLDDRKKQNKKGLRNEEEKSL